MKNSTVFITGINSFVGSHIAVYLKEQGHTIKGSLSDLNKADSVKKITTDLTQIKLGTEISQDSIPENVDVLIYCAHDKKNALPNIQGNKLIFNFAEQKGCKFHIFISSISADSSNSTDYGSVKLELENFFSEKGNAAIVKPGLVMGDGGLFMNMEKFVQNNTFIPLPDGGKYKMAIIEIDELSKCIATLIQTRKTGYFNIYQSNMITLKEIVMKLAKEKNKKAIIVNIPIDLTMFFFKFFKGVLKVFGLGNKFNMDSVAGYKLYKNLVLPPSDLEKLSISSAKD